MTPQPPSQPEGSSLPPRHRQSKDSLASDTSESGFWDLDDLAGDDSALPARAKIEPRRGMPAASALEGAGAKDPAKSAANPVPVLPPKNGLTRRMSRVERFRNSREENSRQSETETDSSFTPASGNSMEPAFNELENWDAPAVRPPAQSPPEDVFEGFTDERESMPEPTFEAQSGVKSELEPEPPTREDSPSRAAPESRPAPARSDAASALANSDEFAPAINPDAKPWSWRPQVKLTLVEAIGVACLALALLAGGFWISRQTLSQIGKANAGEDKIEYPVKGSHVAITNLVTYWRAPITTGDQREIVRRGVVLIPVVEMTLSGGPGAVRILFNNEHGKKSGDPITRAVNGETTLVVPATDGFEDISMHAAYRTNLGKPWVLQVSEAASENAPGAEFKTLLKAPISPEKR